MVSMQAEKSNLNLVLGQKPASGQSIAIHLPPSITGCRSHTKPEVPEPISSNLFCTTKSTAMKWVGLIRQGKPPTVFLAK